MKLSEATEVRRRAGRAGCTPLSSRRRPTAFALIPLIVYIGVAVVVMNLAGIAFFAVLEHMRAVRFDTEQVMSALRAGERWRADIRRAAVSPKLIQEDDGPLLLLQVGTNRVAYKLVSHWALRQPARNARWQVALRDVAESKFVRDDRPGGVRAWRWEVRFEDRKGRKRHPLAFTFQAVPPPSSP